eukprot:CAMPEP_0185483888 /NCGR_PEP_ID=MMETSP1366-20130426/8884_1 /TAXON_ID=38817 /ORGANISM="Gephyrocapsa oceanica, Strain RCC1303" /LENGTH=458 /DNA_ID=CAMNT_0028091885 /DNA_START=69 /DNA_END=1443 /DNA_ORIENTATION=-
MHDALLDGRKRLVACHGCRSAFTAALATATVLLCARQIPLHLFAAKIIAVEDYMDVSMQCVSEFNWNQGQESTYKSATGYFVGAGGKLERSEVPDCAGSWTAAGDVLTLKGNKQPRMFLRDGRDQLVVLDMSTEEVSWTQDVAQLGKDLNGALYATWVRPADEANPAEAARLYCDANDGTGNNLWCPEIDLGEANSCGFRSTSHPVTDLNANSWRSDAVNCFAPPDAEQDTNLFYCGLGRLEPAPKQTWVDHFGNALMFSSAAAHPPCVGSTPANTLCTYGAGQAIDTNREYDVRISFTYEGGALRAFTTTLSQGSNTIELTRQTTPNSFSVPIAGGFPDSGRVALLVQLWFSSPGSGTEGQENGGSGMDWLSGSTCPVANGETARLPAVSDATYTIGTYASRTRPPGRSDASSSKLQKRAFSAYEHKHWILMRAERAGALPGHARSALAGHRTRGAR